MLLFGDECRRTQRGNNNAYCQDNVISWFDWRRVRKHKGLLRFCQALIAFRKAEPTVRQSSFLTGRPVRPSGLPDASWYSPSGNPVDWTEADGSLVCLLAAVPSRDKLSPPTHHVLLMCHAGKEPREFVMPPTAAGRPWRLFMDTGAESPADIHPDLDGPPINGPIRLESQSLVCYVAADES
jgi:glycogen operon protein